MTRESRVRPLTCGRENNPLQGGGALVKGLHPVVCTRVASETVGEAAASGSLGLV